MRCPEQDLKRMRRLALLVIAAAAEALAEPDGRQPARRIVVSIPDRMVALVEDGRVVKTYPAAVGAPATPTPAGTFEVVHRIPHPTWYTRSRVVPPGKANPLGTRWIGISRKGYGIHGTNNPRSIGRPASHGCVRMRNADVEDLFERVALGDLVELHDRRTPELERIFAPIAAPTQVAGADTRTAAPTQMAAVVAGGQQ